MIIHNWHSCLQTIVHVQVNTSLSPTQHGELFWGHFFRQELESHQFGVPSQLRKAKTPSKFLRGDLHSVLRHGSMSSQAPTSSIYSYGIAIYLEVVSCSLFFSLRRVQSKDQGKQKHIHDPTRWCNFPGEIGSINLTNIFQMGWFSHQLVLPRLGIQGGIQGLDWELSWKHLVGNQAPPTSSRTTISR